MSNSTHEDISAFWSGAETAARLKRRHARTRLLRLAGLGAIGAALAAIILLVGSIVYIGYHAFTQTMVTVEAYVDPQHIDSEDINESDWTRMAREAVATLFPEDASGYRDREYRGIVSQGGVNVIRRALNDRVAADPSLVGQTITLQVQLSDRYDQLHKGQIDRDLPADQRGVSDRQLAMYDALVEEGRVQRVFNRWLFTNPDSRFPELAGLRGGLMGSFYALMVCLLISFPVGIAAAVYLEEFAPSNRWTDIIEVNINNLAAVPSIVFGLLGLAVFLNFFGLPRSAPLVGGMVLSLLTLPTIIIATRASLKAVPPSIREGALGIGASRV